jgi:hypothetical protein
MGHTKVVVDKIKLNYKGPIHLNNLFRLIENWMWEKGYDKRQDKDFEHNTPTGKQIEWQYSPWKKITDYVRYFFYLRIVGYDITKTEIVVDGKKTKIDAGSIMISIDAYIEYDYDDYWSARPFLHFLRVIYDYFVFKAYTERFENRLVHDTNHLHDAIEKFLNMHHSYKVISRSKP